MDEKNAWQRTGSYVMVLFPREMDPLIPQLGQTVL